MMVSSKVRHTLQRVPPPLQPSERLLDRRAIEVVLEAEVAKDSFEVVEDLRRTLLAGLTWRRRRAGWSDALTGEDFGLCVNELRLERGAAAGMRPGIAMVHPGLTDFEAIEYAYWMTHWASGALRQQRGQKSPRLFVNMRGLTCSKSGAPRGPWEDLAATQERIRYGQFTGEMVDLIPTMAPRLQKEGDGPLKVARYLPAFPPSWWVQADPKVLAVTNGGYFLNFPEEYEDDELSALHQPIGALYSDNHLHMPPWIERPCAIEYKDGQRRIEMLGPEHLALVVDEHPPFGLNLGVARADALATVWRSFDGELPAMDPEIPSVDLVFSGAGLAALAPSGTRRAPIGGAIVRLAARLAQPWLAWLTDKRTSPFPKWELILLPSREVPVEWAAASGPRLVVDGHALNKDEIFSQFASGEFQPGGPPPTRYPYDADRTRGPRTALGITRSEEWVLVVVDGRTDPAHSLGLTLVELARLMKYLGCHYALNLDGGGSSVMAVDGVSHLDQLRPGLGTHVANVPSDPGARERIVPVSMMIVGE